MKKYTILLFACLCYAAGFAQNTGAEKPTADAALVYVLRPSRMGFAVGFTISCDNILLGVTKGGKYVSGLVAPGKHKLLASGGEKDSEIEIEVEAGKTYYFIQKIKMGVVIARTRLEPATEDEGVKALSKCKLAKAGK